MAFELHPGRARLIEENAARVGVDVEVRVGDATLVPEGEAAAFDVVLVDAPCSGLGTTRRRPELKWRRRDEGEALASLQPRLLEAGARRVRPGGRLVYSVCTPIAAEGRAVVDAFLEEHPEFEASDPRRAVSALPDDAVDDRCGVLLRPHRHLADAFFIACMQRKP